MNDNDYEMIGESIWDTYSSIGSILAEGWWARLTGKGKKSTEEPAGEPAGEKLGPLSPGSLLKTKPKKPKKTKKETPEERAARIAQGLSDAAQYGDA